MTAVSATSALSLAPWSNSFAPETISGSVYAVPAALRAEAARLLTSRGHRVHVDFIIAEDGRPGGVTPEDLLKMKAEVPEATFDAHLILSTRELTETGRKEVASAIRACQQVQAKTLSLSPQAMETCVDLLPDLRESRVAIWTEVPVGTDPAQLDPNVDGALVMLIESGTRNEADRSQLYKVAALSTIRNVGIDGGVTASVAAEGRVAGANLLVSGRALFQIKSKEK